MTLPGQDETRRNKGPSSCLELSKAFFHGYEYIIILNQILSGFFGRRNSANNRSFESGQRRRTLLQYLPSRDPEPFCNRAPISASIIRCRRCSCDSCSSVDRTDLPGHQHTTYLLIDQTKQSIKSTCSWRICDCSRSHSRSRNSLHFLRRAMA